MNKYTHKNHEITYNKINLHKNLLIFFKVNDDYFDLIDMIHKIDNLNSKYFPFIYSEEMMFSEPFLFEYNKKQYVFFKKENLKDKSQIYYCEINYDNGIYIYSTPILALDSENNLSYPYIFENDGNILMLPTNDSGDIDLYECEEFPHKWKKYKTILYGSYINSIILKYDDLYLLFTIQKINNSNQQIIYCSDKIDGIWSLYSICSNKYIKNNSNINYDGNTFKFNNNFLKISCDDNDNFNLYSIDISNNCYNEKKIYKMIRKIYHLVICNNGWIALSCINDNFYENNFLRIIDRWNNRENRIIMLKMYKEIGDELRSKKDKNVLDIGFEPYNIYNLSYFDNYEINYNQIDIKLYPDEIKKISYKLYQENILEYNKYDFFNTVISFGVLGFIEFTPELVDNYLYNISKLLRNDGIFYLKLDNKHMLKTFYRNNIINEDSIYKYFKNFKNKYIIGKNEFTFYVLQKK